MTLNLMEMKCPRLGLSVVVLLAMALGYLIRELVPPHLALAQVTTQPTYYTIQGTLYRDPPPPPPPTPLPNVWIYLEGDKPVLLKPPLLLKTDSAGKYSFQVPAGFNGKTTPVGELAYKIDGALTKPVPVPGGGLGGP